MKKERKLNYVDVRMEPNFCSQAAKAINYFELFNYIDRSYLSNMLIREEKNTNGKHLYKNIELLISDQDQNDTIFIKVF